MSFKNIVLHHLVKSEDLNHHGTLYAGRAADWLVEAGYCAAAALSDPEYLVCFNISGMTFTRPVPKGSIIRYDSQIVKAGSTSLTAYIQVHLVGTEEFVFDGFMAFVHVDAKGHKAPHNIKIIAETDEEKRLQSMVPKHS
jgi:acyl-CoA hydrolase